MDTNFALILGIFFLLFLATSSLCLYFWLNKENYTREKFAFAGLSTASTLPAFNPPGWQRSI
jgi:hypothetical protein